MRRTQETMSSSLYFEPLSVALKSQVWCGDLQVSQLTREQMRAVEHEVTQQNTIALWHPKRQLCEEKSPRFLFYDLEASLGTKP